MKNISVEHLTWRPADSQRIILNDISLDFEAGHIYGILGPNGAGKTSFVRQLCKLSNSDTGVINFDNININNIERNELAKKISFLSQNYVADVDFSVYDVIAMGREPYRPHFKPLDGKDIKIIEEAMDITDCTHLRDKSITKLSGGELQRVMIARTIAQDTPWVILDEPVSSLDVKHQAQIMTMLSRLHQEKGKTVIAILHDLNLATRFCSRLILMKDGQIIAQGSTKDVLTLDNLKKTYEMDFKFMGQQDGLKEIPFIMPVY